MSFDCRSSSQVRYSTTAQLHQSNYFVLTDSGDRIFWQRKLALVVLCTLQSFELHWSVELFDSSGQHSVPTTHSPHSGQSIFGYNTKLLALKSLKAAALLPKPLLFLHSLSFSAPSTSRRMHFNWLKVRHWLTQRQTLRVSKLLLQLITKPVSLGSFSLLNWQTGNLLNWLSDNWLNMLPSLLLPGP